MDCIFCKIVNEEIPAQKIYEDEYFIVFLDIFPATKGHCLIVPKDHYQDIFSMPQALVQAGFGLAQNMIQALGEVLDVRDWNILQNNGPFAGQSVFHFHIHLIPRYESDQALGFWKPLEMSQNELIDLRDKLARYLEKI